MIQENKYAIVDYLSFMITFLQFDKNAPHFETYIRKALAIISETILSGAFDNGTLFEIVPVLFEKVC